MRKLSYHKNHFKFIDGPFNQGFAPDDSVILDLANYFYNLNYSAWAYERHMHFVDFGKLFHVPPELQPNYINIMREPMEHRASEIFYRLTKHFEVNNTSGFDFEKCVTENQKLCHFPPVISQSCFLAGLRPFCRISTDSDHQEYSKR